MEEVDVAIVGAGFSGLASAIELDRVGVRDLVLLEGADRLGGTWRDNRYPGAACDVPSHLYSLSRAPKPDWTHRFARQPEILAYMEDVADRFDLRGRIRLGCTVQEARWDGRWTLQTSRGPLSARFLLLGIGALRDPAWPAIPGLADFAGETVHSSRWPDGLDLRGKRVGLVGTGASAIQIGPAVAPEAATLTVFQRTPPWLRPRDDRAFSEARKAVYRAVPAAARLHRLALWARLEAYYPLVFGRLHEHARFVDRMAARDMRAQLTDPALQDAVVPSYRVGCKRVLLSDDWLPTLERPDVELVTTPIREVTPGGVLLEDGREVGLDVLICATGYRVDDPLGDLAVHGEGGLGLREAWGDRPSAWMGMAVPRFPDLFLILGPNTALGHSSVILMIEAAARYAAQAVRHGLVVGPRTVRTDAAEAFERWADDAHGEHVWSSGCRSWYQNAAGVNYTLWPGSTWSYIRRTHTFDPSVYRPASM